jgi:hypothetical protein
MHVKKGWGSVIVQAYYAIKQYILYPLFIMHHI